MILRHKARGVVTLALAAAFGLTLVGANPQEGRPWDPAAGTAGIKGTVKFNGTAPKRREIDMSAKPECAQIHSTPPLDETVVVNPNNTLKNVFVWVKKGLEGWSFPTPTQDVTLDQVGCTYVPHVLGVQVNQVLKIRSGDPFMHNVNAIAKNNKKFNFSQTDKGAESPQKFALPEIMVRIKCDVHGWMTAYVGVVKHPYFAVTGDDGTFDLKNLPPGEYTLEAWHEKYGKREQVIKIADKETPSIEFTFEGK